MTAVRRCRLFGVALAVMVVPACAADRAPTRGARASTDGLRDAARRAGVKVLEPKENNLALPSPTSDDAPGPHTKKRKPATAKGRRSKSTATGHS